MVFAGKSDVGRKRDSNQDNFIVKPICRNAVFLAVCDGMGGANGGNIASGIAVEVLSDCVHEFAEKNTDPETGEFSVEDKACSFLFNSAFSTANNAVYNISKTTPVLSGMGTTAVAAIVSGEKLCAANVGDSRLYLVNDSGIEQITKDHSYVQYLLDMGEISPEEAEKSPQKNIITRAIGTDTKINVDVYEMSVEKGSFLLLCSDGLSNHLGKDELCGIVNDKNTDVNTKLDSLIALANERGGSDNITAVIAEI
ncbi:MAG: Stp1/IreP family PP2C-type Ser/Thr phosphatase [Ruminococcaceae bacterium]|nr:Stp1/IreP family PP2C-type Ser/Thr phosphatase [Oscillospiraceae bacterium]